MPPLPCRPCLNQKPLFDILYKEDHIAISPLVWLEKSQSHDIPEVQPICFTLTKTKEGKLGHILIILLTRPPFSKDIRRTTHQRDERNAPMIIFLNARHAYPVLYCLPNSTEYSPNPEVLSVSVRASA